jgi:hypothetical protein
MKLPITLFINNISTQKVYYFKSSKISSQLPHYFICVITGNETFVLVCCTSQFDKRKRFAESRGLESSLVWIKSDTDNGLKIDSYVDCNTVFYYTIEEFKILYENDEIEYKGELSEIHFTQIITGIKNSSLIEEEVKDLLPEI